MRTPEQLFPVPRTEAPAERRRVETATEVYIPPHRPDLFGLLEVALRFTRRLGWG